MQRRAINSVDQFVFFLKLNKGELLTSKNLTLTRTAAAFCYNVCLAWRQMRERERGGGE